MQQQDIRTHQELNADQPAGDQWYHIDEWSPGSPIFLPSGFFVYQRLMDYLRKQYKIQGYQEVITPDIWKNHLWVKSEHYQNYRENMFPVFTHWPVKIPTDDTDTTSRNVWHIPREQYDNGEQQDIHDSYSCKSMNCPGHFRIFGSQPRYHNELPLRIAEFGTLHRNENVGSLRGLFRVRKFCQDDAHIFCAFEDVQVEIRKFLELLDRTYKMFGFDYTLELSTRPEKAILHDEDDAAKWETAEQVLREELDHCGKKWVLNEGDGAFYGPKIDVHLTDSLGRSHQCGTIQLDLQLPKKFDLKYVDAEGQHHRPAVLHRAVFGSLERFIGILLEHYQGRLPMWLSYRQVMVCSLFKKNTDQTPVNEYCEKVRSDLLEKRWQMQVDIDTSNTHIKQKVKSATERGYHYVLVLGGKEVEQQTISIRQGRDTQFGKSLDDLIELWDEGQDF